MNHGRSVMDAAKTKECERRILAALRRIVHAIDLHSRRLVSECEITAPQLVCLHMLAAEGELTSRALAAKVHVNPSTLVGIDQRGGGVRLPGPVAAAVGAGGQTAAIEARASDAIGGVARGSRRSDAGGRTGRGSGAGVVQRRQGPVSAGLISGESTVFGGQWAETR
jgi:hypothetical protein